MPRLGRDRVLLGMAIGVTAILLVAPIVLDQVSKPRKKTASSPTPTSERKPLPNQKPVLDYSKFTPNENIAPLKTDFDKSSYSSRVQVRGIVTEWRVDSVSVRIADQTKTITFQNQVRLYCLPTIIKDNKGNQEPSEKVYIDFSAAQGTIGVLNTLSAIKAKIPVGKTILTVADIGINDVLNGVLVVGFGCTE